MGEPAVMPPREPSCATCRELLSQYVDRELSGEELRAVEGHLRTCTRCANESASLAGLKKFVQHWQGVPGSQRFRQAVVQTMIRESQMMEARPFVEAADRARGAAPPPGRPRWVLLAAAVAALAALALFLWLRHR